MCREAWLQLGWLSPRMVPHILKEISSKGLSLRSRQSVGDHGYAHAAKWHKLQQQQKSTHKRAATNLKLYIYI